jgi:hypothetical protein
VVVAAASAAGAGQRMVQSSGLDENARVLERWNVEVLITQD